MSKTPHHAKQVLRDLSAVQVKALMDAHQAVLIDVREPAEFEAERIPGALLFPLSEFDPGALPSDPTKRLILQCGSGKRSATAAQRLFAAGADEASHLAGGIKAWKEAGLPTIAFDPATGKVRKMGGA